MRGGRGGTGRGAYSGPLGRLRRGIGAASVLLISLSASLTPAVVETNSAVPLKATDLRCEYRRSPINIGTAAPRCGWVVRGPGRGRRQSAFRIRVAESEEALHEGRDLFWDSGRMETSRSQGLVYEGDPLASETICVWTVRIWDEAGRPSAWSPPAWFETALLDPDDWEALWIGDGRKAPNRDEDFYRDLPAPLFRREFRIEKSLRSARLHVTGLGYYEARINGARVGGNVLDPGWTDFRDRILYSTYDILPLLREGDNAIGVMLGNGWWNPLPLRMWGRINLRDTLPTGNPCFILRLVLHFQDGTSRSLGTDTTWTTRPGPVRRNNVYLGEVYDAREEVEGWDRPGRGSGGWIPATVTDPPGGRLESQAQPPVRIAGTLPAVAMTEPRSGVRIFDFGENFTGWEKLRIRAKRGTRIVLRFGELLNPDGTLNPLTSVCGQIKTRRRDGIPIGGAGAPETAWQQDVYIAAGSGEEIYEPRFTYHGFRYAELTGGPVSVGPESLTGIRIHSAVEDAGSFECSSDLLNRIQDICRRTFLNNLISVQSDCPHREKFGYGGDLAATAESFIYNFDMAGFYAKAARDWADAARPDGMLTDTAPFVGIQYCGVPWAMAHPHLLLQLDRFYGDRRLVREQYDTARRWMDRVSEANPRHILTEGLSDHESLEETPSGPLLTALYHRAAGLLKDLAGRLDRKQDRERYRELQNQIRAAYLDAYHLPGTGRFEPGTQAGQAFALGIDLAPRESRGDALNVRIDRIRKKHAGHVATGIFGTPLLLDVLSRSGRSDLALEIVSKRSFPSWGYMLENGATTLWETWAFSDDTYSHNHPMFGSVSGWFFKWLAGIQLRPGAVGFDGIVIRPQVVESLDWAKGKYHSVRGKIRSEWSRTKEGIRLEIEIPANTTAEVHVPAPEGPESVEESGRPVSYSDSVRFIRREAGEAVFEVGSGRFVFTVRPGRAPR